jgi:hypothetical protein
MLSRFESNSSHSHPRDSILLAFLNARMPQLPDPILSTPSKVRIDQAAHAEGAPFDQVLFDER